MKDKRLPQISGQASRSAPLHRSATALLADLLRQRGWEEVSIDATDFAAGSQRHGFDHADVLLAQALLGLQDHPSLRRLRLRACRLHPGVVERLAEVLSGCPGLEELQVASEQPADEHCLLTLSSGLVCADQLRRLAVEAPVAEKASIRGGRGAALVGLVQACRHSVALEEVRVAAQRLDLRDVDWMVNAVPDLSPEADAGHEVCVAVCGNVETSSREEAEERIERLRCCAVPQRLRLEWQLEIAVTQS